MGEWDPTWDVLQSWVGWRDIEVPSIITTVSSIFNCFLLLFTLFLIIYPVSFSPHFALLPERLPETSGVC